MCTGGLVINRPPNPPFLLLLHLADALHDIQTNQTLTSVDINLKNGEKVFVWASMQTNWATYSFTRFLNLTETCCANDIISLLQHYWLLLLQFLSNAN